MGDEGDVGTSIAGNSGGCAGRWRRGSRSIFSRNVRMTNKIAATNWAFMHARAKIELKACIVVQVQVLKKIAYSGFLAICPGRNKSATGYQKLM